MALTPGTRIGSYEISAQIGVGGMGEVYRATDTKLGRQVAIKVLPDAVASDAERLARFDREARTLASLNHPHIAAIYGLEDAEGSKALVMELVEGPTLADRVAEGPIPIDEALPIARQIAEALEAAHEQGIIHRDLKPANVKVRSDGTVKVLDFGLAKALDPVMASSSGQSLSPTITTPAMTQAGLILGTAAYMSPEQARGKPLDRRADIWAFGCVIYEMITGRRLFGGEDVTETLASVVKEQPDLSGVPAELRRLLTACLQKDPRQRLRDIGDAWVLLDSVPAGASVAPSPAGSRLPWLVAGAAIVVALIASIARPGEDVAAGDVVRFEMSAPSSTARGFATISPDGRHLALTLDGRLWVRSFDALQAVAIEGTDGATYPFWSPDSASLAFFAGGMLNRVPRSGGLVQPLAAAPSGRGGAWSPNGTIVFSANSGESGLSAVSANGGEVRVVSALPEAAGEADAHRYPQFLPDGERFLYLHLASDDDVAGVYVGSLDQTPPRRVLGGRDQALYTALPERGGDGYLLFRRAAILMAQAFDVGELQAVGAPFPIAERVGATAGNTGFSGFSVSLTGSLAYAPDQVSNLDLSWVDREGNPLGARTVTGQIASFAVSPTQERAALAIREAGADLSEDIWLQSLAGGAPRKFTFGPSPGWVIPVWSPDGDWVAYATFDLAGLATYEIRRKSVSRPDVEETLVSSNANLRVWDWAPDGSYLIYEERNDLLVLPIGEDAMPRPFLASSARKSYASVSPDGRWMAYVSDEQGDQQVFVRSIPPSNALWQISEDGGTMPRWRQDGRELFYRAPDGVLTAVEVGPGTARDGGGAAFEYDPTPTRLFGGVTSPNTARFTYQPSADGQRFAVLRPAPGAESALVVVQNWFEELKRLVPTP